MKAITRKKEEKSMCLGHQETVFIYLIVPDPELMMTGPGVLFPPGLTRDSLDVVPYQFRAWLREYVPGTERNILSDPLSHLQDVVQLA